MHSDHILSPCRSNSQYHESPMGHFGELLSNFQKLAKKNNKKTDKTEV